MDADTYQFLDDPESLLAALRKCGHRIDLFTFVQRLADDGPKYAYPMVWDNFAVLPVSTFDHWFTKQIENRVRVKVRKAEKSGVVTRVVSFDESLVRGIWEVYNECPVRQGIPNGHYGKSFEKVYEEEATFLDHSIFIAAYFEEKMIGFIKLVTDETLTQGNMMNIVSMTRHADKAPTNALVAHAVRVCAERKIPNLLYGKFVYGKKEPDGLNTFKRYNAFERRDVPRYYVPLTALGRIAFRLGVHDGLKERVPEPVLAKLRDLRKTWYSRKLKSETVRS
jgi:hypothetical protein